MASNETLEMVSRSDVGKLRSHNEDAVYVNRPLGLAILADGMGGYNAGEVASGMATTLLGGALERTWTPQCGDGGAVAHALVAAGIAATNDAVYQAAQSQPQYAGMGTTLVMAMFCAGRVTVAHVGDSRLYRLRRNSMTQLTRDHSLLQEQLDRGLLSSEQARHARHKNLVTRALGVDRDIEPEIASHELQAGDIYLLCSDGLNDMLADAEIAAIVGASRRDLEAAANTLVRRANDSGGRDNVSLILVRWGGSAAPARSWWRRLVERWRR